MLKGVMGTTTNPSGSLTLSAFKVSLRTALVSARTENSQQHEKQVDEIKVKGQCTQNSVLSQQSLLRASRHRQRHGLEFLGIIGGQTYKDENANITDNQTNLGAAHKHVYH